MFKYNLQHSKQHKLDQETIKAIFLTGISNESMNVLNLMGDMDVSQFPLENIGELCMTYSGRQVRTGKGL